jgi:hypothetical protein
MRIIKVMAVAVSGVALAGAAALPAVAGAELGGVHATANAASVKQFKVTLNHNKHVARGTKLVATGTGAQKNTKYYCVFAVIKLTKNGSQAAGDAASVKEPVSSKSGRVVCKLTYEPFTGEAGSTPHKCPLSKADAKHHWFCSVALADAATSGEKSAGFAKFTVKK